MSADSPHVDCPLVALLAERIRKTGPITLAEFMESALYHPKHGYYTNPSQRVGSSGDFITSVSVGPLFGILIARQLHEMWCGCGRPPKWTLIEQGANDGRLMLDILNALKTHHNDLFTRLEVILVEPITSLKTKQKETLNEIPNVHWKNHLSEIEPFIGVHLSNELLDAFPVRRFRWSGEWTEDRITTCGRRFTFINCPLDDSARSLLYEIPAPAVHRVVEIAPDIEPWTQLLMERLQGGYVLAFDYGLLEGEWNQSHRADGTLRSYQNHKPTEAPLARPGEQDITAHVDFSRWSNLLQGDGATQVRITDQHRFCVGVAPLHFPDRMRSMTLQEQRELLQFRSLSHPSLFGSAFRVLVAAKSAPAPETLSGFRFPL
jgi:SAM-dependent MidA family methyltransferase